MRDIYVCFILCILGQSVFSQHTTRDNFTGHWENPESWDPIWETPQTTNSGEYITIYGNITVTGSLSFASTTDLRIFDTLVITGNLSVNNNSDIIIYNNAILIVKGNLIMDNHAEITANGYIIILGDIDKHDPNHEGSFTSNDDPVKVFVGGNISPEDLTYNEPDFQALNCATHPTIPYTYSTCSYGNMTDIIYDPIYTFFQSTCAKTNANSNSPVCDGDIIKLTSSGGTGFSWSGPDGFTSIAQNPSIPNANTSMKGAYIITITDTNACKTIDTINVIVNALPEAMAGIISPVCTGNTIVLTSSGGTGYTWSGPGGFTSNEQNPAIPNATISMSGNYRVTVTSADGCISTSGISVLVGEYPDAFAGIDQVLDNVYETNMNASLSTSEKGEWSLISGTGNIQDIYSAATGISGLSAGENRFAWKVLKGGCEARDEIVITVNDLFIPSVITPNNDGKNDFFRIRGGSEQVELIVLNRWGIVEYSNENYSNNWNGLNNKNIELPNDTYFFVVKLKNGEIRKGSVLIKR